MLVKSDGILFLQFLMPFLNKGARYVSVFPLARQMAKREGLIDFNRTYRWRENRCKFLRDVRWQTVRPKGRISIYILWIDVRKLRVDIIVEIRKVITISGCKHRQVKFLSMLRSYVRVTPLTRRETKLLTVPLRADLTKLQNGLGMLFSFNSLILARNHWC